MLEDNNHFRLDNQMFDLTDIKDLELFLSMLFYNY
jgi:hypothetical protein